jgi:hypothetical protein
MPSNQEIIEARLCAYIDNELDAAERAEIEKHLATNPQHRRLIEELRRTSALVHNLPRESAPAELAEAFNAQLERTILLGGTSQQRTPAGMRRGHFTQFAAAAAIIILTLGLAFVVYMELPSLNSRPQIVQNLSRTAVAPTSDSETFAEAPAPPMAAAVPSHAARELDATQAPASVASVAPPAAAAREAESMLTLRETGEEQKKSSGGPLVVVIHASDPGQTRKALVTYLVQRDIAWEPADGEPVVEKALAVGSLGLPAATQPAKQFALAAAPADKDELDRARQFQAQATNGAAKETESHAQEASKFYDALRSQGAVGGAVAPTAARDFYVSCRLTPSDVEALDTALAPDGATLDVPTALRENAEAFRRVAPAPTAAPTTSPSDLSFAAGSVAPAGSANPTTQPSNAPAGEAPAGAPVDNGVSAAPKAAEDAQANNREATDAAAPAAPTTVPSFASPAPSAPAEQPVDVLIVVRGDAVAAAAPTTLPTDTTTQPALPAAVSSPTTEPAVPAQPPATQP